MLISFGAVLGKASVDQLAVVAVLEVVAYAAHKQLVLFGLLSVEDVGGSLSIHLWGAYRFSRFPGLEAGESPWLVLGGRRRRQTRPSWRPGARP